MKFHPDTILVYYTNIGEYWDYTLSESELGIWADLQQAVYEPYLTLAVI